MTEIKTKDEMRKILSNARGHLDYVAAHPENFGDALSKSLSELKKYIESLESLAAPTELYDHLAEHFFSLGNHLLECRRQKESQLSYSLALICADKNPIIGKMSQTQYFKDSRSFFQ